MTKVKYIRCDIYKRGIFVFIGNSEQFIKWCKKNYKGHNRFLKDLKEMNYGLADFHWSGEDGIIRLPKFPKTPEEIAYTAHEVFHAACYLLDYCGVTFDDRNLANEAYSYLIEHITVSLFDERDYETIKI